MATNIYPLTTKTYFADEASAWRVATYIAEHLQHTIVSDYGEDPNRDSEPYWIETISDPFTDKSELVKRFIRG